MDPDPGEPFFRIWNAVCNAKSPVSGGLYKAGVVEKSLVDVYVPFLPLERRHVLLCVRQEASKR